MSRPFLIPGGQAGLMYVVAAPVIMAFVALLGSARFAAIGGGIAIASGPVVYLVLRRREAPAQLAE